MTVNAMMAAEGLAELLARENAALAAMDLPTATALVEVKRAATDAFVAAHARAASMGAASTGAVPVPGRPGHGSGGSGKAFCGS